MRRTRLGGTVALGVAVTATMLAGCGSSGSKSTAVGCTTKGAAATATTKSYRYVLDVGPLEEMYAPGAAPANAKGETMFAGSMGAAMGADAQHVEVHICSVGTDRVVVGAHPTITLKDTTTGTTEPVPTATMQGLGSGQGDYHYGNNANVVPGHAFVATVALNGERADLSFRRPPGG